MKRFLLFTFVCFLGILSCASGPEPLPEEPAPVVQPEPVVQAPVVVPAPAPESPPVEVPFDFGNITEEVRIHTMADIEQLIGNLNEIIRRKDYQGWVGNLDQSYLAKISAQDYLDSISNMASFKRQNIVLKTAQDYFTHVVVPSRANDHVDQIDFDSEREIVKAYRFTSDGKTLLLYELKNLEGAWKIAN
jgi:hypothetical protein